MPFKSYVAELKTIRNSGQATENSYYTALGSFIEDLDPSVAIIINPKSRENAARPFPRLTCTETTDLMSFTDDVVCYKLASRRR